MSKVIKALIRFAMWFLSLVLYSYLELVDLSPALGSMRVPLSRVTTSASMLPTAVLLSVVVMAALGVMSFSSISTFAFTALLLTSAMRAPGSRAESPRIAQASFVLFALAGVVVWASQGVMGLDPPGDDRVQFKRFEPEIRALLLRHDPGELHKVDSMMASARWRNKGKELLAHLQEKYAKKPAARAKAPTPPGPASASPMAGSSSNLARKSPVAVARTGLRDSPVPMAAPPRTLAGRYGVGDEEDVAHDRPQVAVSHGRAALIAEQQDIIKQRAEQRAAMLRRAFI